MHTAVFSGHKVIASFALGREVNRQTASVDERHASALLVSLRASIHVFLVRVGFALQLLEFGKLKALLHGPLNNTPVARNGNKRLALAVSLHPLDFPDNVRVLIIKVFAFGNRAS